jgi:hypothetical protein
MVVRAVLWSVASLAFALAGCVGDMTPFTEEAVEGSIREFVVVPGEFVFQGGVHVDADRSLAYWDSPFRSNCRGFLVYDCDSRDGFHVQDLRGPLQYKVELNGTAYATRDHQDQIEWLVQDRTYGVTRLYDEGDRHLASGSTSDDVPFVVELRSAWGDPWIERIDFRHPTLGNVTVRDPAEKARFQAPAIAEVFRQPFVGPDWIRLAEKAENQTLDGLGATVSADDVEVLCRDFQGTIHDAGSLRQGLEPASESGCRFSWHDTTGDGLMGPDDTVSFAVPGSWDIWFRDAWADALAA